jgi:hypothetical protein
LRLHDQFPQSLLSGQGFGRRCTAALFNKVQAIQEADQRRLLPLLHVRAHMGEGMVFIENAASAKCTLHLVAQFYNPLRYQNATS